MFARVDTPQILFLAAASVLIVSIAYLFYSFRRAGTRRELHLIRCAVFASNAKVQAAERRASTAL